MSLRSDTKGRAHVETIVGSSGIVADRLGGSRVAGLAERPLLKIFHRTILKGPRLVLVYDPPESRPDNLDLHTSGVLIRGFCSFPINLIIR